MSRVTFITGIDTDCGKSVVTGLIGRWFQSQEVRVITQKMIQTGCTYLSEDIETHREIMGVELMHEDLDGTTCPYIFPFPASPHLSASLEDVEIEPEVIDNATEILKERYDEVIIEAAGGIYVPITETYSTLDFVADRNYNTVVVTSSKLGSINHTLLTINALRDSGVNVVGLVYNYLPGYDEVIATDSIRLLQVKLTELYPDATIISVPPKSEIGESIIEFPFL